MRILGVGNEREISNAVLKQLSTKNEVEQVAEVTDPDQLSNIDVLYLDFKQEGLDTKVEDLVDQIEQSTNMSFKIVFLSTAGLNDEVNLSWMKVKDVHEYILQMRYAIKLIDETERPYVILEPTELDDSKQEVVTFGEGNTAKTSKVSKSGVSEVIQKAILSNEFDNQALIITNKEEHE